MKNKTQSQLFYESGKQLAERDELFLFFVNDGMTKEELQTNINKNPQVWARYKHWIDKLPTKEASK